MAHLILAGISAAITAIFVNRNIIKLWKAGLIGIGIMLIVDNLGAKFGYYNYPGGNIYLGPIPVTHIIYIYLISIIFLNWIPRRWDKRILYIIYISALFLAVEAVMFSAGAIAYQKWKFWYSYFLLVTGLSLLTFLSDFIFGKHFHSDTNSRVIK